MSSAESTERIQAEKSVAELFFPSSKPYDMTFSEWTVRWWKWCLSQPRSTNPVNDRERSDRNCANNQIYPNVWFLAGTTDGYAERECIIPKGHAILCPIINFEISTAEDPNLRSVDELMSRVRSEMDKIEKVNVTIDGMNLTDLKKVRVETPVFDVTLPEDNIWGVDAGPTKAAGDGFWLFLKPLLPGSHQLRFGGSCLAGTINIATTYHLTVD